MPSPWELAAWFALGFLLGLALSAALDDRLAALRYIA